MVLTGRIPTHPNNCQTKKTNPINMRNKKNQDTLQSQPEKKELHKMRSKRSQEPKEKQLEMENITSMLKPQLTMKIPQDILKKVQDISKKELSTLKRQLINQDQLQHTKILVHLIIKAEPIEALDNLLLKYITHMEASLI